MVFKYGTVNDLGKYFDAFEAFIIDEFIKVRCDKTEAKDFFKWLHIDLKPFFFISRESFEATLLNIEKVPNLASYAKILKINLHHYGAMRVFYNATVKMNIKLDLNYTNYKQQIQKRLKG